MATSSADEGLADFFDDLVRCETRLYNAVGEKLRAQHGITAAQFDYLRYLRDHPLARRLVSASCPGAGTWHPDGAMTPPIRMPLSLRFPWG